MKIYSALFTTLLALALCGCTERKFKLEVSNAEIFDIPYIDYQEHSKRGDRIKEFTIDVSSPQDYVGPSTGDFYDLLAAYGNRSAGVSVTFDLYFTYDDYLYWGLQERKDYLKKLYGKNHAEDVENYKAEIGIRLLNVFGKDTFQKIHFGEIDLKKRVLRNCTVYGIIYNTDRYRDRNFTVVFDRRNLTNVHSVNNYPDDVAPYVQEITFNYDKVTIPDLSSIDNFVASVQNSSVKRIYNSPYMELFKGFTPKNPQKGNYMLFYEYQNNNSSLVDPDIYGNENMQCVIDPNQVQLIIYETNKVEVYGYWEQRTVSRDGIYTSRLGDATHNYLTVEVFDVTKQKVIYRKTHNLNDQGDTFRRNTANEIKALI